MKRQKEKAVRGKAKWILCLCSYFVQNSNSTILYDIECMRGGGAAQGLPRNLMNVVQRVGLRLLMSRYMEICTKHFGHDNWSNMALTFVNSSTW